MRVFVAGASGAIGTRLVAQLIDRGHEVIGTFRSAGNAERVRALGAEPIALDLLDARAVRSAVLATEPEAIVHQATALADLRDFKHFDRSFAPTNRLRTEGTDALLAAAHEAGVRRFVAQSFASYRYAREGGPVKTEEDPLDPTPVPAMRDANAAMRYLDEAVTDAGGIALRYGAFYGAPNDGLLEPVRRRQFPVVGAGGGVSSFIHLDDAAAATVLALEHDGAGIHNIVDDEPAPMREWLPVLATVLGAKPPRRFPRWLARLFAGEAVVMMATEARGASNAKAKRELGWTLRHRSWREGFVAAYASTRPTAVANLAGPRRPAARDRCASRRTRRASSPWRAVLGHGGPPSLGLRRVIGLRRCARRPMTFRRACRQTRMAPITPDAVHDRASFGEQFERHRRELHVHCYRMLGSFEESEDLVQETFLRAWRRLETFEGRSSLRAWLYKIATNACLDALDKRPRAATPAGEVLWLQPYPDELLTELATDEQGPEDATVAKETIELAFMVAIQRLAPLQRAAFILRDVLGYSARDTAALLETSVPAVNSALQRARAAMRGHLPERRMEWAPGIDATAAERELLERYMRHSEDPDPRALKQLLHEDVRFSMPPQPGIWEGRDEVVGSWIDGGFGSEAFGSMRCVPTRANRQPAVACYVRRPGDDRHLLLAIDVLRIEDGAIIEIVTFDASVCGAFGVPESVV